MRRPPRARDTPLLSGFLFWRVALVSVLMAAGSYRLFLWRQADGGLIEEAPTLVVNSFMLFEIAYLFNCRHLNAPSLGRQVFFGNRIVLLSIATVLLLQAGFTYLGFMNTLFGSAPIRFVDWALAAVLALLLFAIVEGAKWVDRLWSGAGAQAKPVSS